MKVICDRSALLDAINLVSSVVTQRSPRPQLTCVLLRASKADATLTLSGTDAEMSLVISSSSVDVQEDGSALIPADKIRQILSAHDSEPTITLECEDDMMTIRGRGAVYKVYGYSPDDFPELPDTSDTDGAFTVDARDLDELITRTIFATARENSRYAINGVLLNRTGKKIEMVATDGRRLALARGTATEADDSTDMCIVPSKALNVLHKLISSHASNVRLAITTNQIIATVLDEAGEPLASLSSNLVEGTFPPYEDVIPRDQDKKATFDTEILGAAVRRAALLTNEESRGVRLAFTTEDGNKLTLSSRAPEMGEAKIEVEIKSYDGEAIEIGFNPAFIIDALKIIDDSEISLELKNTNKPGLIKSGPNFVYVVMPVNLQ